MTFRLGRMLLLFGYLVVLIEVLQVAVAWWKGEIETFGPREWLAAAAVPVLVWLWWRASVFAQRSPRCLTPDSGQTARRTRDSG